MSKINGKEEILIKKKMSLLSDEKKHEVLDFIEFLTKKTRKDISGTHKKDAVSAVNESWGKFHLSRGHLMFVAEDKSIEYET